MEVRKFEEVDNKSDDNVVHDGTLWKANGFAVKPLIWVRKVRFLRSIRCVLDLPTMRVWAGKFLSYAPQSSVKKIVMPNGGSDSLSSRHISSVRVPKVYAELSEFRGVWQATANADCSCSAHNSTFNWALWRFRCMIWVRRLRRISYASAVYHSPNYVCFLSGFTSLICVL